MLVGYAAGGGVDALARIVAGKLGDALGQQVVVDNRPGAGATVAADALAKSAPDGYTLYFADTAILIAPAVYPKLTYDPVKSFAPVGNVVSLPLVFVANPAVPGRDRAGTDRAAQGQPRQVQLRLAGVRHRPAPRVRALQEAGGRRRGAHSLQGRRADRARPPQRPDPAGDHQRLAGARAVARRQAARRSRCRARSSSPRRRTGRRSPTRCPASTRRRACSSSRPPARRSRSSRS